MTFQELLAAINGGIRHAGDCTSPVVDAARAAEAAGDDGLRILRQRVIGLGR